MLKSTLLGILFFTLPALSSGGIKMPSTCVMLANQQLMDYTYGYDSDGAALYFDNDGKTVIPNQDRIVKKSQENGIETIIYKSRQPKTVGYQVGKMEFETVEKTIVITRAASGKLQNVSKKMDIDRQIKNVKDLAKMGFTNADSIVKSMDSSFVNNGDNCELEQTLGIETDSLNKKIDKKVYYDKKFCDNLAPFIKKMGTQNLGDCGSLIGAAQSAFNTRNQELGSEGKSFKEFNFFGATTGSGPNVSSTFNLGMAIQTCALGQSSLYGGGYGMGYPTTYGGFPPFSGKVTEKAEDTKKPGSR